MRSPGMPHVNQSLAKAGRNRKSADRRFLLNQTGDSARGFEVDPEPTLSRQQVINVKNDRFSSGLCAKKSAITSP
jgi:hypothetical protein